MKELVDGREFRFTANQLKELKNSPTIVEFRRVKNEALTILDDIEKWIAKRTEKW